MSVENLQEEVSSVITENIVKEMLQKSSGLKQVIVDKIIIEDGNLTKGYSFLSSVMKFRLEGTGRESNEKDKKITCAVLAKTLPKNIGRRKSFRSTDFFRNEVIFYNEVWETLLKFQDDKKIKNKFNNLPLCLSAMADGINDYIALEDLSPQNYGHFKKEKEMDYESAIFIIRLFARFHALSFAFKDQFPKEFEHLANTIEETYFHEKFRSWYSEFHKSLINCSRDAIEKELPPSYLTKFEEFVKSDIYSKLCKVCAEKDDKLSVFTQGDAWIPNFLVKYGDNNELLDIKMIDFQLARCCSPSCDVSFFLYACTSYELYNDRWDDIIKEYHSAFTTFLSELGSDPKIFSFEDFEANLRKNAVLGYAMTMEAMPFQLMDESDAPDLDTIEGTEAVPVTTMWKVYPIKHEEGRQKLANLFKHVVDKGFISAVL